MVGGLLNRVGPDHHPGAATDDDHRSMLTTVTLGPAASHHNSCFGTIRAARDVEAYGSYPMGYAFRV